MKRLTQMAKVLLMTFCLIFLLCNFHHLLQAEPECETEPVWMCQQIANMDCEDLCIDEEGCQAAEFWVGTCIYGGCFQWYDIYCETGYLTSEQYECWGGGCPMK